VRARADVSPAAGAGGTRRVKGGRWAAGSRGCGACPEGAAPQVRAREQGWQPLRRGGGGKKKGEKESKKKACTLFIYSEPRSLPITLCIARCPGKSCSEAIFVTREQQPSASVPLGERAKHFCETFFP